MARLTADRPSARAAVGLPADGRWIGLGLVAALVVLALLRVALGGWAPLAPDDARYLYVGLSILDGHGPVTPSGSTFLLRSPVYGLALATGSSLVGGDPLIGARLVALGLSLLALAGALRLGWLLAGPGGALGTAFALVAAALIWRLIPSLRIDLPQTAAIVATLLAIWRPTTRRWALGGVLLGLAILVKETALPLLILPVAFVGSVPPSRLARLSAVFVGAAVLTAGWWWLVVWLSTGQVFPLNALSVIEARDVDVALRVDRSTALLLALAIAGWGAGRLARPPRHRRTPPAGRGHRPRPCGAVRGEPRAQRAQLRRPRRPVGGRGRCRRGVARCRTSGSGERPDRPGSGASRRSRSSAWRWWRSRPRSSASATPAGSRRTASATSSPPGSWRTCPKADGSRWRFASANRWRCACTAGRTWRSCRSRGSLPRRPPEDYLWMGLRDRQLFGYRRAAWSDTLSGELGGAGRPADLLVLVGPHPFTPTALTATPGTGADLGLTPVATLEADGDRAEIYRVTPGAARRAARASRSTSRPRPPRPGWTWPAATPQPVACSMLDRSWTATRRPSPR